MTEPSAKDFLARHVPFDRLEPDAERFMVSHLKLLHFSAGQRLAGPDSGRPGYLYLIVRGQVRVAKSGDAGGGRWTLGEGECFPIGALSGDRPTTNLYDAVGDLVCYGLPAEHFHQLVDLSKAFARHCNNYLSNLVSESRRNLLTRSMQFATDQQALSTELRQLIKRPPVAVREDSSLRAALELIDQQRVGSVVAVDAANRPLGIFTQSDVLRRVVLAQAPLSDPVSRYMSPHPIALPWTARVYDAMFTMAERGVRHLLVVDDAGCLAGVVSERDLFALQRIGIGYIRRTIDFAPDVDAVAQSIKDIHRFALNMLGQGVGADQLTRFISALNDAATRRIIEIDSQRHDLSGIEWSWLAFGSEGREEQTISTDQDNGIVFQVPAGADEADARSRLLAFAQAVNADLDRCGYPLCEGNIMAGNPEWCLTLDEWKRRFGKWVMEPAPQALLNASIFFDFRTIHGAPSLAEEMHRYLFGISRGNTLFQRMLAANALAVAPPLGMFRDFVTESNAAGEQFIDLKKSGARLFVDAARVFALAHGIECSNTVQRLRRAAAIMDPAGDGNDALIEAFNFIQLFRLRHQADEIGQGRPGDNRLPPTKLNQLDRRILKEAFRQARRLQKRLNIIYQLSVF